MLSCRFHSAPEPGQERPSESSVWHAASLRNSSRLHTAVHIFALVYLTHHTAFGTGTLHTARTCPCPELLGHLEAGTGAQHNHLPKLSKVSFWPCALPGTQPRGRGEKGHFLLPNFQHFLGITSASSIAPALAVCKASRERSIS